MYNKFSRIHMIGVGGIGMSGIAELLVRNGYSVSGSDLHTSDSVRRLQSLGVDVHLGHRAEHVKGAELVVYSSAINALNEEFQAAREREIPLISRAEMLAELMRLKYGIAVAGAHGKTTTTSMVSLVLVEAGLDPTIVVGGRLDNFGGTNARLGEGNFMVVEADESDGSFNRLSPSIAIATNLDREHMDHYRSMKRLRTAFTEFLNKVPFYGVAVVCGDDPNLRLLLPRVKRRKIAYGFSNENDYRISNYSVSGKTTTYDLHSPKGDIQTFSLTVPGRHNVLNAVAATVIADELLIARVTTVHALSQFRGVERRFHHRGDLNGVSFIDDYAHHPSEIKATLEATKERFPKARVHILFQPHRYSRFVDLFDRFTEVLSQAHAVAVTPIYAAGETPISGIQSDLLVKNLNHLGFSNAKYYLTAIESLNWLRSECKPGDVILTLGAGDLPNLYRDLF